MSFVTFPASDAYYHFEIDKPKLKITVEKKTQHFNSCKGRAYESLKILDDCYEAGWTFALQKGLKINAIAKTIFDRSETKICWFCKAIDRIKRIFCVTKREEMQRIVKKMELLAQSYVPPTPPPPSPSALFQSVRKSDNIPYDIIDYFTYLPKLTNFQMEVWDCWTKIAPKKTIPESAKIEEKSKYVIEKFCNLYNMVDFNYVKSDPNHPAHALIETTNDHLKTLKDKVEEIASEISKYYFKKAYAAAGYPPFDEFRKDHPEAIQMLEEKWSKMKNG